MADSTDPAPAGKPDNPAPPDGGPGKRTCSVWNAGTHHVLTITQFFARKAAEDTHYLISRLPSDWGASFELVKVTDDPQRPVYHVLLCSDGPLCDCPGFLHHGMGKGDKGCRHVASLLALQAGGKLDCLPGPQRPAPKALAPQPQPQAASAWDSL